MRAAQKAKHNIHRNSRRFAAAAAAPLSYTEVRVKVPLPISPETSSFVCTAFQLYVVEQEYIAPEPICPISISMATKSSN